MSYERSDPMYKNPYVHEPMIRGSLGSPSWLMMDDPALSRLAEYLPRFTSGDGFECLGLDPIPGGLDNLEGGGIQ